jgi:hypothetical protein
MENSESSMPFGSEHTIPNIPFRHMKNNQIKPAKTAKPTKHPGGRPWLGKKAYRFTMKPETRRAIGRAAYAAGMDSSLFVERAMLAALDAAKLAAAKNCSP